MMTKQNIYVFFDNFKIKFRAWMMLNRQVAESLEFALISAGKASPESCIQFVSYIDIGVEKL